MKKFVIGVGIFCILIILGIGIKACSLTSWWLGTAEQTLKQEVNAKELLRKYEWFKDASAQLDKKLADIQVYEARLKNIDMSKAERVDKEQSYVWMSEVAGIKASYNQLASEYNSQMAKINWRFTNVGQLPEGATQPLPKEYKPYIGG